MPELLFLTGNQGKFREASVIFQDALPEVTLAQDSTELVEIQSDTLEDVAIFKLKHFIEVLGHLDKSCFTEDAGFFVTDHLNGFPGVYSAYVQKTIGNDAILHLLEGQMDRRPILLPALLSFPPYQGKL